jgi:hypothetical protein
MCSPQHPSLFTLVMKFHDRQSSERCIWKLISRYCLEKTCTRWNDFLFLITDDRDFRPQTCTNGLVFRECKHIKNIFEDVYFTKNLFHITLRIFKRWKINIKWLKILFFIWSSIYMISSRKRSHLYWTKCTVKIWLTWESLQYNHPYPLL